MFNSKTRTENTQISLELLIALSGIKKYSKSKNLEKKNIYKLYNLCLGLVRLWEYTKKGMETNYKSIQ